MKIPSNKIEDIINYYKVQLKGLYDADEIKAFVHLSFQQFLNISPAELILKKNERITESDLLKFSFLVRDLKKQKPIQYIFGETEFYGLKMKVNPSVLIPRPETEELVDWIIKDAGDEENLKILDICTGSGCIAISLKKNLINAEVSALDISLDALKVATENAELNKVAIDFSQTDILAEQQAANEKFDIIVSNPPYVTEGEKSQMQPNVLEYEPHLALFVKDEDSLVFYKAICSYSLLNLKEKGHLYLEINESKGKELEDFLIKNGFNNLVLKNDLSGKHRMIKCSL